MTWLRRAIRLDIYRQVLMDSPEVPESVKSTFLPYAEQDFMDEIVLRYKVPIHERLEQAYYKEKQGLPELRKQILDDAAKRKERGELA